MPDRQRYTGERTSGAGRTRYTGNEEKPTKKKGGGGILGAIKRLPGATASDLYHIALNTPGGIAAAGKAEYSAVKSTVQHPLVSRDKAREIWTHPLRPVEGTANTPAITALGKANVEGVKETVEHPLRHPGQTLLTVLPVASGAARAGMLARSAATGVPRASARTLAVGDLKVHPELSRSGLGQVSQLAHDKALQKLAARKPGGRAEGRLHAKVGKTLAAQTRMREQIAKGPGQALHNLGRKLTPGEQKALQVVAEQAPLKGRITAASARVTGARTPEARGRHQTELDLLHKAQEHLTERGGLPAFASPKLESVYRRMAKVAGDRETLLKSLGMLTDESIQSRKTDAGRVALGATYEKPTGILGQEQFAATPSATRIPDVATRKGVKALNAQARLGSQGTIGKLKAPGSTTHAYSGVLREHAVRRQDTTALVAESSLEAAKYVGLKHLHDQVRKAVSPAPRRADDLAVRLDNLGTSEKMPLQARKFLTDPEDFFKTATPAEAGSVFDKIKAHTFIDPKTMSPEDRASFTQLEAAGKIGWVPRKMLGNLAKPSAPLAASAGRHTVGAVDAINNAQRAAILYLKPAYAVPNLIGNAALNIIQQGFSAPRNLATAARLDRRLGPEIAGRVDAAMGEGFAMSLSSHNASIASTLVDKAARFWSKGVDKPFRRAAFLHEARRAGYRTPADLERLLTDNREIDRLTDVSLKANREIIDYADLSPVEREIVRRIVFFYPWVKGSTVYTGRILREHPVASAALAAAGERGYEQYQQDFPEAPSYFEGAIKAGSRVVNPASAGVFGAPAQIGRTVHDVTTGRVSAVGDPSGFATPAISLAQALLTRQAGGGYSYPAGTNAARIAQDQLVSGLPQASLYQGLRGQSRPNALYPPSAESAIGRFLVGGLYPRKYDPWQLAAKGRKERQRLGR